MPFREATALVTVEREGVLDARVVALSGKEPVIEVPVRGRVRAERLRLGASSCAAASAASQPTALVDLGRPAFKLGIAEIKVGWRALELKVAVSAGPRGVQDARDGPRAHRRAHRERAGAAGGERGRARRGGRGPARARRQSELEPPRGDDGAAELRRGDGDRADAGRRQAPLRPQGAAAGRRRRPAADARAVRHAAALEGARAARRRRRRRRSRCRSTTRSRASASSRSPRAATALFGTGADLDPHDAGPDGAARPRRRSCARAIGCAPRSRCATPPTARWTWSSRARSTGLGATARAPRGDASPRARRRRSAGTWSCPRA